MEKITLKKLLIAALLANAMGLYTGVQAAHSEEDEKHAGEYCLNEGFLNDIENKEYHWVALDLSHGEFSRSLTIEDKFSGLQRAVVADDAKMVQLLIDNGVPVNYEQYKSTWLYFSSDNALIHFAVEQDKRAVVPVLLDAGAHADINDLIASAAFRGHTELVELLVQRAEVYGVVKKEDQNGNALSRAVTSGKLDIVKFLKDKGFSLNNGALHAAVYNNGVMLEELLDLGADINAVDGDGNTALMVAARDGRIELAHLLIQRHADVHATNKAGWNALMFAVYYAPDAATCEDPFIVNTPEAWQEWTNYRLPLIHELLGLGVAFKEGQGELKDAMLPVVEDIRAVVAETGAQDWNPNDLTEKSCGVLREACSDASDLEELVASMLDLKEPQNVKKDIAADEEDEKEAAAQEPDFFDESFFDANFENYDFGEEDGAKALTREEAKRIAVMQRIEAARARRLAGEQPICQQAGNEHSRRQESAAQSAGAPASAAAHAMPAVHVNEHINQQLEHAHEGDGVRCPACGVVQEDAGFFDCTVCGARI